MENKNLFYILLILYSSILCIITFNYFSLKTDLERELNINNEKILQFKTQLSEKDFIINYYDSLYVVSEIEKERVIKSFKLIIENDATIKNSFKKYYTNHDSITWSELDSLLTVLVK